MDPNNKKAWLDNHVVPIAKNHNLIFHAGPFWKGSPADEVLVFLLAESSEDNPAPELWPQAIHTLLAHEGFRFDVTREQIAVQTEGQVAVLFGGDGTPIFGSDGMASVRLIRRESDGVNLIVQLGCQHLPKGEEGGKRAASAVKGLFALFEDEPFEVIRKFGAQFGQA